MRGDAREAQGNQSPASKGPPLPWARRLADVLTFTRLAGGVALGLWPWEESIDSLRGIVRAAILLWSTDAVDGHLARRSRTAPSAIGRHDLLADVLLTVGAAVALVRAGLLPPASLALWTGLCALLYALRPVSTVILAFMFPLQLALPVLALLHGLPELLLFVVWAAALAVLNRKRLKWVIDQFIEGLPDRLRRWVRSWLPGWLELTPEERADYVETSFSSPSATPGATADPPTRLGDS